MELAQSTFDYGQIPAERRGEVRDVAVRIKGRLMRAAEDIIAAGLDLIAVKDSLPHGQFTAWVESEVGISERTAQNFMNTARRFEGKTATVALLAPAVLYAIAAPSTPDDVVDQVVASNGAGNAVTVADVNELKAQIARLKGKASGAKATEADALSQLRAMREELRALRDERDTLMYKIQQAAQEPVTLEARIVIPEESRPLQELKYWWSEATEDDRESFMVFAAE